jgi:hypothetical protein
MLPWSSSAGVTLFQHIITCCQIANFKSYPNLVKYILGPLKLVFWFWFWFIFDLDNELITIIDLKIDLNNTSLNYNKFYNWIKTRMTDITTTRGHIYKSCNWDCIICFLHIDLKISLERCIQFLFTMFVTQRSLLTMLFNPARDWLILSNVNLVFLQLLSVTLYRLPFSIKSWLVPLIIFMQYSLAIRGGYVPDNSKTTNIKISILGLTWAHLG